jgi:hypothetical protein
VIHQKEYAELNEDDTLTARYEAPDETFEVTGKVYIKNNLKYLAGKSLAPGAGGHCWTIIKRVAAEPAWYSAVFISAWSDIQEKRDLYVRDPYVQNTWFRVGDWQICRPESFKDVKVLLQDARAEL